TTSRASTPFRRSACTFCHGTPAVLTGQWVTRNGGIVTPSTRRRDAAGSRRRYGSWRILPRVGGGLGWKRYGMPFRSWLVPLHLVEVPERAAGWAHAGGEPAELL